MNKKAKVFSGGLGKFLAFIAVILALFYGASTLHNYFPTVATAWTETVNEWSGGIIGVIFLIAIIVGAVKLYSYLRKNGERTEERKGASGILILIFFIVLYAAGSIWIYRWNPSSGFSRLNEFWIKHVEATLDFVFLNGLSAWYGVQFGNLPYVEVIRTLISNFIGSFLTETVPGLIFLSLAILTVSIFINKINRKIIENAAAIGERKPGLAKYLKMVSILGMIISALILYTILLMPILGTNVTHSAAALTFGISLLVLSSGMWLAYHGILNGIDKGTRGGKENLFTDAFNTIRDVIWELAETIIGLIIVFQFLGVIAVDMLVLQHVPLLGFLGPIGDYIIQTDLILKNIFIIIGLLIVAPMVWYMDLGDKANKHKKNILVFLGILGIGALTPNFSPGIFWFTIIAGAVGWLIGWQLKKLGAETIWESTKEFLGGIGLNFKTVLTTLLLLTLLLVGHSFGILERIFEFLGNSTVIILVFIAMIILGIIGEKKRSLSPAEEIAQITAESQARLLRAQADAAEMKNVRKAAKMAKKAAKEEAKAAAAAAAAAGP